MTNRAPRACNPTAAVQSEHQFARASRNRPNILPEYKVPLAGAPATRWLPVSGTAYMINCEEIVSNATKIRPVTMLSVEQRRLAAFWVNAPVVKIAR